MHVCAGPDLLRDYLWKFPRSGFGFSPIIRWPVPGKEAPFSAVIATPSTPPPNLWRPGPHHAAAKRLAAPSTPPIPLGGLAPCLPGKTIRFDPTAVDQTHAVFST